MADGTEVAAQAADGGASVAASEAAAEQAAMDQIKFVDDDGDGDAPEAAPAPAKEASKPAPKKDEKPAEEAPPPPVNPTRAQIALREQERRFKAEQRQFESQRAELAARIEAAQQAEQRAALREKLFDDPGEYLTQYAKARGVSEKEAFQAIAKRLSTGEAPVREELAPLMKEQEELRKEIASFREERAAFQREQAVARVHAAIGAEVAASLDEFPLLDAYPREQVVAAAFQAIAAHYNSTGEELDKREALGQIHAKLEDDASRLSAARQKRLTPQTPPRNQPASSPSTGNGVGRETTPRVDSSLATARSSLREETDEDRVKQAMDMIKFIDD